MQLKTLADAISVRQIIGPLDRPVENIAYDSRRVQRNGMFVALRGEKTDGHNFIEQAIEKGATVIVTQREELRLRLDAPPALSSITRAVPSLGWPRHSIGVRAKN